MASTRRPPAKPAASTSGGDAPLLRSVTIALQLIEVYARNENISLSEVARQLGLSKSTVHRTCGVLAQHGFLERTPDARYRLGLRFLEYGDLVARRTPVRDKALPLLVELRNAIGETVQVGIPIGGDVLYVERVEGQQALRYSDGVPRRGPVHRSSAGKVLAAFVPGVAEARLKAGLPASTGYTIVSPKVFMEELALVRERGFARSVEETEAGMASLAVPVRSGNIGPVVAAISAIGPTVRLAGSSETRHIELLKAASLKLGQSLQRGDVQLRRRR
jgi:DNA-binding IclR family transcriptional regulator